MPLPFVVNCQLRLSIASAHFKCRVLFACKSHVSFSLRLNGRPLWKRKESVQRRGRITRYWLMLHPLCFNSFTLSGPAEIHLLSLSLAYFLFVSLSLFLRSLFRLSASTTFVSCRATTTHTCTHAGHTPSSPNAPIL